jgi:hypothetical protein
MTSLKNDAHAALAQASFQLVPAVEHRFAGDRVNRALAIIRTMVYLVCETAPAGWTFSHSVGSIQEKRLMGSWNTTQ